MSNVVPPAVDVGVFWDYENVRIPGNISASAAANRIRSAAMVHGRIVERKLYYDLKRSHEVGTDRSSLDACARAWVRFL